jgi:hypothetical protein
VLAVGKSVGGNEVRFTGRDAVLEGMVEGGFEYRNGRFRRQGVSLKKIGKEGWVARGFNRKGRGSGGRDGERNSRLQERQRIILIRLCDYVPRRLLQ